MSLSQSAALSVGEEFTQKIRDEKKKAAVIRFAPLIVIAALIMVFAILEREFISADNFFVILKQLSIPLILSIGLTFVILMGSIDLSVEGVMGLTGSLASVILMNSKTALNLGTGGILLVLLVGTFAGFLTGIIHVKGRLPSFMVSFGMSSIASGFALLCYKGVPATIEHPWFISLNKDSFMGVPLLAWIAFFLFLIAYLIQEYTPFGRYIYAIGDNETIPRQNGIDVNRIKVLAFMWAGFCVAVAGLVGLARSGRGDLLIGKGNLFPSITAVVVGGTVLSGGTGGMLNTLMGALIVTILENGLILTGVNPYIRAGIQGTIIIAAVAVTMTRGRKIIIK
jgi:ribose transport system permease protein